jgi:cholesterol transport system auxiliary component
LQRNVVLAISAMRAAPGFDTPGIAYVLRPHEIDYFTKSRWADAPARMLAPLIARALEQCGAFRAVVYDAAAVAADLRLDTELVRLQQEFIDKPSRVRLTVRARLVDLNGRRAIALREIEEIEPAVANNAYAGVEAANRALQRVLARLVEFSIDASR